MFFDITVTLFCLWEIDVVVLEFGKALESVLAEVAAEAGLFEAAKWGFDVNAAVAVDAEDAAFDLATEAKGAFEVVGPQRAA